MSSYRNAIKSDGEKSSTKSDFAIYLTAKQSMHVLICGIYLKHSNK